MLTLTLKLKLKIRRYLPALVVALGLQLAFLSVAAAHAVLVRSEPADNATVAHAPAAVRMWFSEPLAPGFSQAQVLNSQGRPVPGIQVATVASDPTLLTVTLPQPLPDDVYSVVYTTLSAADGHAEKGHIVFKVGNGPGAVTDVPSQPPVDPVEAGLRWLDFASQAGLIGALAVAFVLLRALPPGETGQVLAQARRRVLRWGAACGLAALVVGVALLARQATLLAQAVPGNLPVPAGQMALQLIISSHTGMAWVGRQVLLAVMAVDLLALSRLASARMERALPSIAPTLAALGAALVLTGALSGHAVALAPATWLAVLVDWAHLAAASLWLGGLATLAVGLLPLAWQRRATPAFGPLARAGWQPFGALAAASVAILFATGLYSAGREVASVDALITTFYGRALIVKVALVLAVGLAGLVNSSLLHPAVAAPLARLLRRPQGWTPLPLARLPILVLVETALGLAVFLLTGLLASASPPHGPQFAPAVQTQAANTLSQQADDLKITFEAQPNQPGANTLTIHVAGEQASTPPITRVRVNLTYLGQSVGTVTADAQQSAPGVYQVTGSQLSLPGPWQIDVAVRRRGVEDSVARFSWTVATPVAPHRVIISDRPWEPLLTAAGALILLLLLIVGGLALLRRPRPTTAGGEPEPGVSATQRP